ncbi:IclR family transcriptional regulator [Tessaracoccus rhinocerotis]|uniref:IclR family transcriptional regulator n=1 Tax=Tessaracoccus rhinocerotis TaxID=1689449 RepID=UPI00163DB816|nr:IclR family transcriptional regulator C-terminal domain-containing protein [Tessaracoccus rhinocerotis]
MSDELQETASVGIRRGASVFYLAKIEARALFQIPSGIGQSLPANCTGIGKALLSALTDVEIGELYPDPDDLPVMTARSIRTLPDLRADLATTRERGYAIEDGESTPGLHCAASVVRDVQGAVVAAISTSVPDVRWISRSDAEWAAPVLAAAAELSAQLGYRAP